CGAHFDSAGGTGAELENLDGLMGKAKVLEGKRQWAQALDALNKAGSGSEG
ncbi:TTC21B, partial [Symbiodinium microadriaticum]